MQRYFQVFAVTMKEYFAYRLNFVLWRVRMVLSTLVTLFLWLGVFDSHASFGSYSKERLLSYLLFSSLVTTFISSSRISEFSLLVFFFKIPLVPPQQLGWFLLFFASAVCISFSINLMLSFIGFWTPEVWAPRFLFMMIVTFISGSFFPLDLLPPLAYRILLFTPFPYMYFMPTKILVDGVQNAYFIQQCICSFGWAIGLFYIAKKMWKVGIKDFSFWGK